MNYLFDRFPIQNCELQKTDVSMHFYRLIVMGITTKPTRYFCSFKRIFSKLTFILKDYCVIFARRLEGISDWNYDCEKCENRIFRIVNYWAQMKVWKSYSHNTILTIAQVFIFSIFKFCCLWSSMQHEFLGGREKYWKENHSVFYSLFRHKQNNAWDDSN